MSIPHAEAVPGGLTQSQVKDYLPHPQSHHVLYQVDLAQFVGPMDLLLFLIKRHDIDIFNIPIAKLCETYTQCLESMQALSIDVAAEFLFMAAELLLIKSKLLRPPVPQEGSDEDEDAGDPRAALVERLLAYQKFQAAAAELEALDRLDRDVFAPPADDTGMSQVAPRLRQTTVFSLVQAFNTLLQRQKPQERHKVVVEQVSVHKRMHALVQALTDQACVAFTKLFAEARDRLDLIVGFLAVLELTRLKLLRLMEDEHGALMLQSRFDEVEEAYARMQGDEPDFR